MGDVAGRGWGTQQPSVRTSNTNKPAAPDTAVRRGRQIDGEDTEWSEKADMAFHFHLKCIFYM